jgi:triosephosphate isomerase
MARRLIGTSWKMNLTSTEAAAYCRRLLPLVADIDDRELFVLPPFTDIWAVREELAGSRVAWGAQHVHPDDSGAHTGDVSAPMLADLGCTYVEVGHSERRRDYAETDAFVTAQVGAIQRHGMTAIVCVGEQERAEIGPVMEGIGRQLAALSGADRSHLIVAYEPVWAIGVGAVAAEPDWIGWVHQAIEAWFRSSATPNDPGVPVIYGGSVDIETAPGILAQPAVSGLFVGRSALEPDEFARIAHVKAEPAVPG